MRTDFSGLKECVERAPGPDPTIELAIWKALAGSGQAPLVPPPLTSCVERVLQIIEQVLPGFVYLMWRDASGRHHASLAADDRDLDIHAWRGQGASPALACSAALLTLLAITPSLLNGSLQF